VTDRGADDGREQLGAGRWPASGREPLARTVGACALGLVLLGGVALLWPVVAAGTYGVLLVTSIVVEVGGWSLAERATTPLRRIGWVLLRPFALIGLGVLELLQVG
jgi:hypothetical protein